MQVQTENYLAHLEGFGLTESRKLELIDALEHFCVCLIDSYLEQDSASLAAKNGQSSRARVLDKSALKTGIDSSDSA